MFPIKQIICLLSVFLSISTQAQDISSDVFYWLSEVERDKIHKAESLLDQGEEVLFSRILDVNKDRIQVNHPDYIELSENLYLGKRICRQLYETKDYFYNGFRLKLEVYRRYIDDYINEDNYFKSKVEAINDSINVKVENAKTLRSKSLVRGNISKAGKDIHQANLDDQNAILLCEKVLGIISSEKSDRKKVDEVVTAVDEEKKEAALVPFSILEHKPAVKEVDSTEGNGIPIAEVSLYSDTEPEVYYTVQILADKKKIATDKIKRIYKVEFEIIEYIGDGWYRYSFGKFTDLSIAKQALLKSNTRGYIVAYRKESRISLKEAKSYFINFNHSE